MTGKHYGQLTTLEVHHRTDKHVYYRCQCVCGRVCIVRSDHLLSGNTKSCGCLKLNRPVMDMGGQQVDVWKIIQRKPGGRQAHWLCECTVCGRRAVISGYRLRTNPPHC